MGEGQLCFRRRGRRQPWKTFTKVNYVPNSKNWPTATTLKHFQNSFTNIKQFRTSAGSFSQTKIDFVKLQLQQFSPERIFFQRPNTPTTTCLGLSCEGRQTYSKTTFNPQGSSELLQQLSQIKHNNGKKVDWKWSRNKW